LRNKQTRGFVPPEEDKPAAWAAWMHKKKFFTRGSKRRTLPLTAELDAAGGMM
jgi:hypothetical protein